jgi:hypothetical protein
MDNKRKIGILREMLKDKEDLSWGICVAKPVSALGHEEKELFQDWLEDTLPSLMQGEDWCFPLGEIDSRVEWIEEQIALLEKL